MNTTTVAGLDQQTDVGIHERHGHGDSGTVGQDKVGVLAEALDEREDVIPTATVETGAVVAEFVDDLIHLKSSGDGLDQNGTTDGSAGDANVVLGQVEDIVPQTSLQVRFHLGQVEVRTEPAGHQLPGVVVEVQTKVKQTTGDGLAIDGEVLLIEVPASSTGNQSGESPVRAELVFLVALLEVDLATDSIVQVDLTVDHVVPGGGTGVYIKLATSLYTNQRRDKVHTLEISHVGPDIRVQCVDDHLPVGRTSDLDTTVNQTRSRGSTLPSVILPDVLGLRQEVEQVALVNLGLTVNPALEESLASGVEGPVEDGEESTSILGEDLAGVIIQSAQDGDILELSVHMHHFGR